MKLHITESKDKNIEGYQNINVSSALGTLPEIVDHSCEEVILNNSLSKLERQEALQMLELACSRVRMGGKVSIYDIDIKTLCVEYLNRRISQVDMSQELYDTANCIEINEIRKIVNRHGIVVESCYVKGYQFELVGYRKNNE